MVKIKINNLTISLRKATGYTQGNSHKAIGWLFSRNFAGHKEKHIVLKVLKEKTKQQQQQQQQQQQKHSQKSSVSLVYHSKL